MNRFLPWDILLIKKLEFEKTKPTQYPTFKTDITKVGLVLSISNFFIDKISQKRNRFVEKIPSWDYLRLSVLTVTFKGKWTYLVIHITHSYSRIF